MGIFNRSDRAAQRLDGKRIGFVGGQQSRGTRYNPDGLTDGQYASAYYSPAKNEWEDSLQRRNNLWILQREERRKRQDREREIRDAIAAEEREFGRKIELQGMDNRFRQGLQTERLTFSERAAERAAGVQSDRDESQFGYRRQLEEDQFGYQQRSRATGQDYALQQMEMGAEYTEGGKVRDGIRDWMEKMGSRSLTATSRNAFSDFSKKVQAINASEDHSYTDKTALFKSAFQDAQEKLYIDESRPSMLDSFNQNTIYFDRATGMAYSAEDVNNGSAPSGLIPVPMATDKNGNYYPDFKNSLSELGKATENNGLTAAQIREQEVHKAATVNHKAEATAWQSREKSREAAAEAMRRITGEGGENPMYTEGQIQQQLDEVYGRRTPYPEPPPAFSLYPAEPSQFPISGGDPDRPGSPLMDEMRQPLGGGPAQGEMNITSPAGPAAEEYGPRLNSPSTPYEYQGQQGQGEVNIPPPAEPSQFPISGGDPDRPGSPLMDEMRQPLGGGPAQAPTEAQLRAFAFQDGKVRVIPTVIDGEVVSANDAMGIAEFRGLENYPTFSSIEEAELWIADNSAPQGPEVGAGVGAEVGAQPGVDAKRSMFMRSQDPYGPRVDGPSTPYIDQGPSGSPPGPGPGQEINLSPSEYDGMMGSGMTALPQFGDIRREAAAVNATKAREERLQQFPPEDQEWAERIVDATTPQARFDAESEYFSSKWDIPAKYRTTEWARELVKMLRQREGLMNDPGVRTLAKDAGRILRDAR